MCLVKSAFALFVFYGIIILVFECELENYVMNKKIPWDEYPRPQMKRKSYYNLNGLWKLDGRDIVVPYPPQSKLSEYKGEVLDEMVYEKTFNLPSGFDDSRILLHFGAVDQIATVWINGKKIGEHIGGYLPFYFDITDAINANEENVLKVEVKDSLDTDLPYGKQTKKPGGMWYTPVSGIWQTVWLECVPENYIKNVKLDVNIGTVKIKVEGNEKVSNFKASINLGNGDLYVVQVNGDETVIELENPINWTPENPYLYNMTIEAFDDSVETYFALRTISVIEINGVKRVCLNNKPIFLHGVLDQGYFYDGIFTPENSREYDRDIMRMKELGFNMLRKHIKIEPDYFYYACDKMGMLVMQDMVNTGTYSFLKDTALPTIGFKNKNDIKKNVTKAMENFIWHTQETMEKLHNHPSIVAYTIFNEGWGQFNSDEMYDLVKSLDGSRLVDSTSGWYAQKKNDFDSEHIYFKIKDLEPEDRPLFVTECGGYKMLKEGYFYGRKEYGYGACKDENVLMERIEEMYEKMIIPGIKKGACGCIYTQLSDVEDEINGLYTYDRRVCKVDKERMKKITKKLEEELW